MKVHLIRHGETDYNQQRRIQGHSPSVLSESGIAQAKAISNELSVDKPALIISSQMIRAVQTTKIIAENHNLEYITMPVLNSRDFGDISGFSYSELKEKHPEMFEKLKSNRDGFTPPNGESTEQIEARVRDFIGKLVGFKDKYKSIIIVTHREIIPILLRQLKTNLEDIPDHPYQIENCKIYSFDF